MKLIDAANIARNHAYAPYSGFAVGAAVLTADGQIFAGCNVENVAYPEGTCAEAGAIAAMIAAGGREIVEIAVISAANTPITPCGGCRQKIAEFASPKAHVILANTQGEQIHTTVGDLLPGAFANKHMDAG